MLAPTTKLIVTQGGVPVWDQAFGVRLFRDAAGARRPYRLHFDARRSAWRVYHAGREILDGPRDSPAAIIDYLAKLRGWRRADQLR